MSADLRRIESRTVDTYDTVTANVTPYVARVGDRAFVFNRRPSAAMQLRAMRLFASADGDEKNIAITPENIEIILDVISSMLGENEDVEELFAATDLETIVVMMDRAINVVTTRPTTASSDSGPTSLPTISPTGSSEQVSTTPSSTAAV